MNLIKRYARANKMVLWVRVPATMTDNLSLNPRLHMTEGENCQKSFYTCATADEYICVCMYKIYIK